ncbi:cytochrome c [Novipirellula rosea]|uniref:C-type cytochrome n=1 Tax=Novipirellula rosea TaxID=1031540 RepID=A0ABP8MGP7_9BACT
MPPLVRSFVLTLCPLPLLAVITGCDAKIEQFEPNTLYSLTLAESRSAEMDAAQTDTSAVLEQVFGTPNEPKWPSELLSESARSLIDVDRLARSAGPISSLQDGSHLGLYREHCVHCHGLSGDGFGPTSLALNPYPRDFRHGVFKWKSTRRNAKPTRADLRRTLVHGEAGTAMPSFSVLPDEEIDALVDYVIYLSIRGEVERELLAEAVELGYDTAPPEENLRIRIANASDVESASDPQTASEGAEATREIIQDVVNDWARADETVVEVPAATSVAATSDGDSIERGRELFHGQIANCVGCHGPQGNGAAVTLDYDDWTKEYSTRLGLTPTDRDAMKPFRKAGAPKPRPLVPRRLQGGVFRGGGDGETLYRRITQGVAGTPMPSLEVTETESGKGLTPDQVWDLVRYVQSLGKP